MSITFFLPSEFCSVTDEDRSLAHLAACPECKGQGRFTADSAIPSPDCETCFGYGGNQDVEEALLVRRATEDGEFNVANGNGAYIVQDILNLSCDEVYGGSVAPHEILTKLSYINTSAGVLAATEDQGVHLSEEGVSLGAKVFNFGRSESQCERYVENLHRLATIAIEKGAPMIHWG